MTFDWTQGDLAKGLRRYNAAEYFAAHESWEAVWLTAPPADKPFLQGLIQVTAAFEHQRRHNLLGTHRLLTNALRRLDTYPPVYGNLDLTQLRADLRSRLASLEENPANPVAPIPIRPLHSGAQSIAQR
jgi:predicted metal-dependent hydrolase